MCGIVFFANKDSVPIRNTMSSNILKTEIRLNRENKIALTVVSLYAVITFVLCLHHEMWGDELNVWMALKNYSFLEVFRYSSEEGNPIFFFLPLLPFVKIGFSAHFIQFFCWLCSVLAIFLLNFLSPFSLITKILITFSAPMIYHYSVMARCYSVLPPLMFITALLYPVVCNAKKSRIISRNVAVILYACCIAAISCTHIIAYIFAGGLAALFIFKNILGKQERNRYDIAAAAIMVAGIVIVTAQTMYALAASSFFEKIPITPGRVWTVFASFFSSMADGLGDRLFNYDRSGMILYQVLAPVIAVAFFVSAGLLYKCNKYFAGIIVGTLLFYLYVSVSRWGGSVPYRVYVFLLVLISLSWAEKGKCLSEGRSSEKRVMFKALEYSTALIMLLTIPTGIEISREDWKKNFSSAGEVADFIKANISPDDKSIILCKSVAIAYHLDDRTVYYDYGKPLITIPMSNAEIEYNISELLSFYDNIYFVSHYSAVLDNSDFLKKIYTSSDPMLDEKTHIYKFIGR